MGTTIALLTVASGLMVLVVVWVRRRRELRIRVLHEAQKAEARCHEILMQRLVCVCRCATAD